MANKMVKYIVVLLLAFGGTVKLRAQTDTAAGYSDTTLVDDTSGSTGDVQDGSQDNTGGLAKFRQRQPLQQVGERKVNGESIEALKKENGWWYNKKEEKQNDKSSRSIGNGGAWRALVIVFWVVIIGAFVLIIILYLRTFTGSGRKIRGPATTVADIQEDIFTTNFDEQVNRALAEHNYRLATRLLFLRVLRTMAEKGVISYGHDKTNMDYLFELGSTKYARDFMQASRNYEYVWYGNFTPAQSQFAQIRQQLDDLNQKIT